MPLDGGVMARSDVDVDALEAAGKSVIYDEDADPQHGFDDSAARIDMLTTIGRFLDSNLGRGG